MIGANTSKKGKLMAGITRAAFNTRSIIVDSSLQTGLETFCIRKNLTLIGIAPENCIELPRPNPGSFSSKVISNGHTHFILLGSEDYKLKWGEETSFKLGLIERLISGRKGFEYKCKTVGIILGNIPSVIEECLYVKTFIKPI